MRGQRPDWKGRFDPPAAGRDRSLGGAVRAGRSPHAPGHLLARLLVAPSQRPADRGDGQGAHPRSVHLHGSRRALDRHPLAPPARTVRALRRGGTRRGGDRPARTRLRLDRRTRADRLAAGTLLAERRRPDADAARCGQPPGATAGAPELRLARLRGLPARSLRATRRPRRLRDRTAAAPVGEPARPVRGGNRGLRHPPRGRADAPDRSRARAPAHAAGPAACRSDAALRARVAGQSERNRRRSLSPGAARHVQLIGTAGSLREADHRTPARDRIPRPTLARALSRPGDALARRNRA